MYGVVYDASSKVYSDRFELIFYSKKEIMNYHTHCLVRLALNKIKYRHPDIILFYHLHFLVSWIMRIHTLIFSKLLKYKMCHFILSLFFFSIQIVTMSIHAPASTCILFINTLQYYNVNINVQFFHWLEIGQQLKWLNLLLFFHFEN